MQEGDEAEDLADQPRIVLKSKADTEFLTNLLTDPGFVQQPGTKVPLEGSSQPKLWANMQAGAGAGWEACAVQTRIFALSSTTAHSSSCKKASCAGHSEADE